MSKINYNNIDEILRRFALGRSTLYTKIKQGLFIQPVKLGKRKIAWPQHEVDQIALLYSQSPSDQEVRAFVLQIENGRSGGGKSDAL